MVPNRYEASSHSGYDTTTSVSPARAAPVHDFGSVVSGQFTEPVIAVNNRPVHDLRISQQETGFCNKNGKKKLRKANAKLANNTATDEASSRATAADAGWIFGNNISITSFH